MAATSIKSIEQERAAHAWTSAQKNKGNDKFASIVAKLPAYIKANGLMNTLAFLYSKSDYAPAFELLSSWLVNQKLVDPKAADRELFMKEMVTMDARQMMACTAEAMALINWVRRFT